MFPRPPGLARLPAPRLERVLTAHAVRDGSRAWLEIRDNRIFSPEIPEHVTSSLFVNEDIYLVLANYGESPVELASLWIWQDRESGETGRTLILPRRGLRYFRRVPTEARRP